ncbi:MAG: hypothetical protein ACRDGG_00305, partial [Anaerolineae bacterium]
MKKTLTIAERGVSPQIIIEPTYGTGNFIHAVLKSFPKAELGALDARNLPVKRNLKALNGLDAIT